MGPQNERGINIAQAEGQRGNQDHDENNTILNVEGSILEEIEDSQMREPPHSIEELQRLQAETLTDDEFDDSS